MKKKLFFSFSLISYIGIATALPLLVLGLTGRYLDRIYSSSPKLFIIGITIAALTSFCILRSITTKAIKTLSKETE
jgi:hypothetical protein